MMAVNLGTATVEELQSIPNVGPTLAENIQILRTRGSPTTWREFKMITTKIKFVDMLNLHREGKVTSDMAIFSDDSIDTDDILSVNMAVLRDYNIFHENRADFLHQSITRIDARVSSTVDTITQIDNEQRSLRVNFCDLKRTVESFRAEYAKNREEDKAEVQRANADLFGHINNMANSLQHLVESLPHVTPDKTDSVSFSRNENVGTDISHQRPQILCLGETILPPLSQVLVLVILICHTQNMAMMID
jgi:hypothetical protein